MLSGLRLTRLIPAISSFLSQFLRFKVHRMNPPPWPLTRKPSVQRWYFISALALYICTLVYPIMLDCGCRLIRPLTGLDLILLYVQPPYLLGGLIADDSTTQQLVLGYIVTVALVERQDIKKQRNWRSSMKTLNFAR